jgi:acetoin utilization deacetylase AcuC-like enzyme
LPEGAGSKLFREAMEAKILPRVDAFAPDLIVISAGFDGHRLDPIGGLHLEVADFSWITNKLMEIAQRRAKGRVVSTPEGGYDLVALARCASSHVQALMGA